MRCDVETEHASALVGHFVVHLYDIQLDHHLLIQTADALELKLRKVDSQLGVVVKHNLVVNSIVILVENAAHNVS
jgi:hypothetical protein